MPLKVLIVYYSFTQQTRLLVRNFAEGLEQQGFECVLERLIPLQGYDLPFVNTFSLMMAMTETFFRKRMPIRELSSSCFEHYDCVVLAGPTWSYYPSGPVLQFLDSHGEEVCAQRPVVPLISCRSYWRIHFRYLKKKLTRFRAQVEPPVVFIHPVKEPWRVLGLLMQLRGKMMRKKDSWFRKRYPGYGHTKEQGEQARVAGENLGRNLIERAVVS